MPIPIRNYPRSKVIPGLPTAQQFYSTAEVAIILETNIGVVHEWIKNGLLTVVHFGNEEHMQRVRSQDLEDFIDAHIRNGLIKPDGPIYRRDK
jgi:hypothetical protein